MVVDLPAENTPLGDLHQMESPETFSSWEKPMTRMYCNGYDEHKEECDAWRCRGFTVEKCPHLGHHEATVDSCPSAMCTVVDKEVKCVEKATCDWASKSGKRSILILEGK
jgi:hypothetical protein